MSLRTLPYAALLPLAVGAMALPQMVIAQSSEPESASKWGLGLGVGFRHSPYAGADNKNSVLPILTYEGDRFKLAGTTLDWKLGNAGPLSFAVRSRYDLAAGYEADDSAMLSGMTERKSGLWLGGQATWTTYIATLSMELLRAAGHSKGIQARVGIERDFRAGAFIATPRAGVGWQDKKYVNYYYGVTPAETTLSRQTYRGESNVNFEVGLRTAYVVDRKQSVFLDMSGTSLGSKIKESPLVDKKTVSAVAVGYLYRF